MAARSRVGLIGRDDELSDLLELAGKVRRDDGGWVAAIVGEPGIGKSALVDALASELPEWCSLVGRCAPPPAPLRRPLTEIALGAMGAGASVGHLEQTVFGAGLRTLLVRDSAEPADLGRELLVAEGLLQLISTIPGGPVLVTIEDAHWADDETLDILDYVADHVETTTALWVVTTRPNTSSRLDALVPGWLRRSRATRIDLDPLLPTHTAALIEAEIGAPAPEAFVAAVQAASDGSPLLTEEFARQAVDGGALVAEADGWRFDPDVPLGIPPSYRAAIARLLDARPGEERWALQLAALCGRTVNAELLVRLGVDPGVARRSIEAGHRSHLLQDGPLADPTPRFRHALTQEAVAWSITTATRESMATAALDAIREPDMDEDSLEIASRLAAASGDRRTAWELQIEAVRRAVDVGAGATALTRLDEAASIAPADVRHHPDTLELRLRALSQIGRGADAVAVGDELVAVLTGAERLDRLASVSVAMARAAGSVGDWDDAARRLDAALADLDSPSAEVLAFRGVVAIERGEHERARACATRALTAQATGAARCEAFEVLGRIARETDFAAAAEHFRAGVAAAEGAGLDLWMARSLMELGLCEATVQGRPDAFEEAHRRATAIGALSLAAMLEYNLANFRSFTFDERAVATAHEATLNARRIGASKLAAMGLVVTGQGHAMFGRRAEARVETDRARRSDGADAEVEGMAAGVDGLAALMVGDVEAARAAFAAALVPLCSLPVRTATGPWYYGPVVLAVAGHPLTGDLRDQLVQPGFAASPHLAASVHLIDAIAAGAAGDADAAKAADGRLRAWVAANPGYFERIAGPLHLLRTATAESALAGGWGTPIADLEAARDWFVANGGPATVAWCKRLLREAGVSPPTRGRSKVELPAHLRGHGITTREYEVLGLVGERLTNKEIAHRLTISLSTVKSHIERLLAKTGRANRVELAELARVGSSPMLDPPTG